MPKAACSFPPSSARELGDTLYVTMGIDGCLAVYPQETWDTFTAKFAALPMTEVGGHAPPVRQRRQVRAGQPGPELSSRPCCGSSPDLEKDAVITGVHNRAEIWSAERWQEKQEEITPEKMNAILKGLGL